ncbi:Secologanin synthase protein [Dioscorea alata]|uniref:Secologanin synthase protein n=1 Tax=Dioscorea alata TaxID=55571 RepID=A0ACB7U655_DIOAL|nr:Secologanin synthase protein [Dioscorea alata]
MEQSLVIHVTVCVFVVIGVLGRVLYSVWLKPKMLEMQLRRQGLRGNKYRPLADIKDEAASFKEAWSRPMELTHKIIPRVIPYDHQMLKRYGKSSNLPIKFRV